MQNIVTPDFMYLPLTAIVVYSFLLPLSRSALHCYVDVEYTLPVLS